MDITLPNGITGSVSFYKNIKNINPMTNQPEYSNAYSFALRVGGSWKTFDPETGAETITYEDSKTGIATALVKENRNSKWYMIDENGTKEISQNLLNTLDRLYAATVQDMAGMDNVIKMAATTPSLTNKAIALTTAVSSVEIAKLAESEATPAVFETVRGKIAAETEHLKSAAALEKSVRDEMERVLRELELEKLLQGDRNFLSVKEDKTRVRQKDDEERLASIISDGFQFRVVPEIVKHFSQAIKAAIKEKTITIGDEGDVTIKKGFKGPASEARKFEKEVSTAWETINKVATIEVFAIAETRTRNEKANVILDNSLLLTQTQRVATAREMDRFLEKTGVIGEVRDAIVQSLGTGNVDRLMKAVNRSGDERVFERLYGIMLKVGTEEMNRLVLDRVASLESSFAGIQVAGMVEKKAKEMKIELSADDRALMKDISDDGLRQHRERALTRLSGLLFEVMGDVGIVGRTEKTDLPKVGKA
jgi:hypothetical protein